MQVLERIWEIIGLVFGGLGRSFERSLTSLFGSSNARYIKRLQPKVDAINALEPKYQAMSDAELQGADGRVSAAGWPPAKRSTTCWPRPLPSAARRAAAC